MERKGWIRGQLTLKSVSKMKECPAVFSVGGFTAKTEDGKDVHFDWDDQYSGYEYNKENECMYFHTQLRTFNDDVYEEMNKESGIEQLSITPEFLKDTKLTEVFYECYMNADDVDKIECEKLELVSFNIYGEVNGKTQDIYYSEDKIKEFNILEAEEQKVS